ncbi:MAG TPA: hypothetical protein VK034_04810, partial [Enhygromyxa sp.]|nr:hypothetical protein [Enhygromyxa sp.]
MSVVVRERRRIDGQRGYVVCDTRHLPIVVVQWHGEMDLELLDAFGRWMEALLDALEAEGVCMATLIDPTRAEPPSAENRRALSELRDRHQRRSRGRVVVDVIVSDRPRLRGLVQAMIWITPHAPAVPVATVDEGLQCS